HYRLCVTHAPPHLTYTLPLHDALPISAEQTHRGKSHRHAQQGNFVGRPAHRRRLRNAQGKRFAKPAHFNPCGCNVLQMHSAMARSEDHTSELQSRFDIVCRLLLEKKNSRSNSRTPETASYDFIFRPRRFFGSGSTPFGYPTRPPLRSVSRQRVSSLPPMKARRASMPPGAKRRAEATMSLPFPSTASSAPRRRTKSIPSLPEAVANTRAPRSFANCNASIPTLPLAPWMIKFSPASMPSASSTPCNAVSPIVGIAPACRKSRPPGISATLLATTATYSA